MKYVAAFGLIALSIVSAPSFSPAAPLCSQIFAEAEGTHPVLEVLGRLQHDLRPDQLVPRTEALAMLRDEDVPLSGKIMSEVVSKVEVSGQRGADAFKAALREVLLAHHYTEAIVQTRLAMFESAGPKNWRAIFGDLSLKEVHRMFYGDDIRKPSPDSLVGKYMAETGAKARMVRFPKVQGGTELGPERLVISVSPESFAAFQKTVLESSHYMTVVGHANVMHKGLFYSFGGGQKNMGIRAPGDGTPMPMLLLKTTEAQRLNRYMELTADTQGWGTALKQPWQLNGYCARGGYTCCTHWIGNIPMGDRMVTEYSFPPPEYGNGAPGPQVQPLKQFDIGNHDPRLKQVWKVPGHEQLADVIGQHEANVNGEMASPGWVIQTLSGRTAQERVPVLFWMAPDHRAEIPEAPHLNFERPW